MEKRVVTKKAPAIQTFETVMYIGPDIRKHGLSKGVVVKGNFEERYASVIKEYPVVKNLFVKVDNNLGEKKKNLLVRGTAENVVFEKIKSLIGG